ncbi:MAG: hypothetical protein K2O34_03170 [Acetatifactor sp.]|nr:hypothetical protein [Acetatifactor sp.]
MSTIWMLLGGFLILLGLAGLLLTVLFEQTAVRRLKRKYAGIYANMYTDMYTKPAEAGRWELE